ncbi:C-type lectin domain family 4 member A-like isoform X2 [Polypterus senegalus]|uniref:C-type lectin domain family 4 member A-like isoform X2 n=1 Tax=Polypterus senegalus TaxID=55291 RepID=UPI0019644DCB|nr:C-type lectin domain family 4 member A-like isoform X2 [Polypterus senegalus]
MTKESFSILHHGADEYSRNNSREKGSRADVAGNKPPFSSNRRCWFLTIFVLLLFIVSLALLIISFQNIFRMKREQKRLNEKVIKYNLLVKKLQDAIEKDRGNVYGKLSDFESNMADLIKNSSHFKNSTQMTVEQSQKEIADLLMKSIGAWTALQSTCANTTGSSGSSDSPCGAKWLALNDSCYYFVLKPMDWFSSKKFCANYKATLVVINSEEEQEFITEQHNSKLFWIGLSDTEEEGNYKWEDGTNFTTTTTFWRTGQPDDYNDNEDCIALDTEKGTWNDAPCNDKYFFICENTTLLLDDINMQ